MRPDVLYVEGKYGQKECVLVGTGSTLAYPLGDCTVGTSYVTHTACIPCIIHHIHALAPKLALLGKSNAHLLMWKMHVAQRHMPELPVPVYSCLHCLYQCIHTTVEEKNCLVEV